MLGRLGCCWDSGLRVGDRGGAGASSPELSTLQGTDIGHAPG